MSSSQSAQNKFDEHYITSGEIQERLGVHRSAIVVGRRRGRLPEPVVIRGVRAFIWERAVAEPYLQRWETALAFKRCDLA